jgi:hypothetical protein
MNKYTKYLGALLVLVATNAGNFYFTKSHYYMAGMQDYHGACYFVPGARLDNDTGTVVYCYPLGQADPRQLEQERKNTEKNTT